MHPFWISVLYFLSFAFTNAKIICEPGVIELTESCVLIHKQLMHFCEANEYCNNRTSLPGQHTYLIGSSYNQINFTYTPVRNAWTSLTELHKFSMDNPRQLKTGDPQMVVIAVSESESPSHVDYTGGPLRVYHLGRFEPADDHTLAVPLCETSELPTRNKEKAVIKSFHLKVQSSPVHIFGVQNGSKGCFTKSMAQTYIECQFRCRNIRMCRVAYYNAVGKSCWFSMYVDSLLPVEANRQTGIWQRTEMNGVY
ncbi:hypothetical protein EG68_11486 [Paragonimus skrjabini miyazakii]|uniref:Apple domain-containing protein n=1 Tax=Paragonimus skrjabini miyazakii TaxID=59628 RepID=A0A8S9YDI2_9TREM|nr:hypothetical protein EG68_11486 [Paragonimus skrjabini miyazakii]